MFLPFLYFNKPKYMFNVKVSTPNWFYRLLIVYIAFIVMFIFFIYNYQYTKKYIIYGYINNQKEAIFYLPTFLNINKINIGDQLNKIYIDAYPNKFISGTIAKIIYMPVNEDNDVNLTKVQNDTQFFYKSIVNIENKKDKLLFYPGLTIHTSLKIEKKYLIDWLFVSNY